MPDLLPAQRRPAVGRRRRRCTTTSRPSSWPSTTRRFVTELGVQVVGGCCGTTPEHIRPLVERVPRPRRRPAATPEHEPGATSIYSPVPFDQDTVVPDHRRAHQRQRLEEVPRRACSTATGTPASQMAKRPGEGGRPRPRRLRRLRRPRRHRSTWTRSPAASPRRSTAPLVLDSTEPAGASRPACSGSAAGPSSTRPTSRTATRRAPASTASSRSPSEYGAAVICLLIDEEGQARDVEWKMRVAHRIHDLAVDRYGLEPSDLIFDALTFPLSTGDDDLRRDGIATIEAIRRIKAELPGRLHHARRCPTCRSASTRPPATSSTRCSCTSACEAGLDSAIVHAAQDHAAQPDPRRAARGLPRPHLRPARHRPAATDADADYDPLQKLLEVFADVKVGERREGGPLRLAGRAAARRSASSTATATASTPTSTRRWPRASPPLAIINDVLLAGMKVVGELFGSGEMQLPFVLQSAETMKAAVAYLEPHMEKVEGDGGKGRIVLATVKGDVHDIGKNLVDIILTNNGYEVHNLGIKVSIAEMIEKALEVEADAIGMSGLLVKSHADHARQPRGAERPRPGRASRCCSAAPRSPAPTSSATCARVYDGRLFYGKDAFEGLHVMDRLGEIKRGDAADDPDWGRVPSESTRAAAPLRRSATATPAVDAPGRSPEVDDRQPGLRAAVHRLAGRQGHRRSTTSPPTSTRPRCSATSGSSGPRRTARTTTSSRTASGPILRDAAGQGQGRRTCSCPQVVYGYFPANGDGNDLVIWKDETRTAELDPVPLPAPDARRRTCASPTSSARSTSRRGRLRRLPHRHDGRARSRERDRRAVRRRPVPGLPAAPRPRRRDGRGAGRVLAPPHPRGVGLRRRGRPVARRAVPPAVPRRPLLVGLPGLPRPRGQREGAPSCSAPTASASSVNEETGFQYQPEQTTSALICHHPQAKYFVAR